MKIRSGIVLYFVDFDFVVPMSAGFLLGSCKSGRIVLACGQHGGSLKQSKQNIVPNLMVNPA